MRKLLVYIFLSIILISLTFLAYYFSFKITGRFVGFGQAQSNFKWWNISWHYRFRLEINSTKYERKNWPVEIRINFTDLLPSGTFDENSTRVIEYDENGDILYEIPSQFDKDDNFNPLSNAIGTLVFLMNGTTGANQKRIFFVYYDALENGAKEKPNYPTNLTYTWDGEEINVSSSYLDIYIDTNRAENTSGIYEARRSGNVLFRVPANEKTTEYLEYFNGSEKTEFDLIGNATFIEGPVRLTIKQTGDEIVFGNPNEKTNEARIEKKYYIYNLAGPEVHGTFIRIEQKFINTAPYQITRNSTEAGALAFDLDRSFAGGIYSLDKNSTEPYSWVWARDSIGMVVGILNLNQTNTQNFYATNSSSLGRIGIQLNETNISQNSWIYQDSLVYFGVGGASAATEFYEIVERFATPIQITKFNPERWYVAIQPSTNATVYNRNETVLITANISSDPYNLTKYVNATLDMGTSSQADDQTLVLYDDGTHGDGIAGDKVFTNTFNLVNDATVGIWRINFTAYTENYEFLNYTLLTFNVTDLLNVTVSIRNKKPMVGSIVVADIYVKNFRQDTWIAGATINCSYDSTEVINKTDYNNGTYSVNFTAPTQQGTYVLACNATKNGNFGNDTDTFTTEPGKTSVSIEVEPENPTVSNITLYQGESFEIAANASNVGNGTAYSSNISLELLNGWQANSTLEQCGDIDRNSYCSKAFEITVPNETSPGNYIINVSVTWRNPDGSIDSNKTQVNITVQSNPKVDVEETKVGGEGGDGIWSIIGNFTVSSIGNDQLINITFSCISGEVCNNFSVEFIPKNISSLAVGSKKSVSINVTVPLSYGAGIYNGSVNVSSSNDGFDTFEVEVIVPANRTWDMHPKSCQRSESPPEGLVCEVNVTNLGNTYINFTVSPEEGNYTKVNETSFSVNAQSYHVFSVTYNVTGVPPGLYNSTFVVDAVEDANPDNMTLKISLVPYVEPIIELEIKPNKTQQFTSIEFFVNATDRSGTGMDWVKLNITLPNGTVQPYDMVKTYESGNLTSWYFKYESGNTSQRGRYNVTVYARDKVGNVGTKNSTLIIYYKFNILVSTLSDRYYQGDQGSIYYSVRDLNDEGVANVSVEFMIEDPNGNITYYSSYKTNSDGTIYPLPSFTLASDAPLGIYTLISTSSYFDDIANETFSVSKNYTFEVLSRTVTVTGLFADIETAVVWYPDNIMKFGILTYNGEGKPVDADFINLTVYRPDGLLYFTDTIANMEKEMTGFYTYERSMPSDSPTGMYLAVVNATQGEFQTLKLKAFRVARGGPYDLWVELLENEVRQGDYLDFNIRIENKGEVSQDVFLEWWVSGANETYYYESGWFYTPSLSNQTITKQAYIFTTQPQGTYTLTVKMTYDSVQPPLIANRTFTVLAKEVIPPNITVPTPPPVTPTITYTYPTYVPTAAAVAPAPTAELAAEIRIISYRENISVVRGASKVESVIVKNTGEIELENITFLIFGIPITWYNITPETIRYLPPGNSTVFLITFNIPANANLGEHRITLTVLSGVVSDQKYAVITVFKSLEELLRDEISKLKSELALLEQDVKKAEKEGKDVSLVMPLIEDIRIQIELAEDNLKNNKLEDALENVRIAKNLIDRARDLLSKLQVKKAVAKPFFPIWLIALILVLSILIPTVILLTRKKIPALRPYIVPLGRVAEKVKEKKKEAKEELVRERERLLRMLEVLEKEREEGIISLAAYKEMKKNIEEKLKRIEKKLR